ncbi:unnamed protein product [Symbiodinium natans]|uniref:Fe/B12 periplasmic-binding domain-containing protein n=1 Tax=Symbiodinium natans TaxID=878477 RepID=A0A812I3E0_9DINO|nr:unnamed protein product [Symbiodinium natans]
MTMLGSRSLLSLSLLRSCLQTLRMSSMFRAALMLGAAAATNATHPVTITNCGVQNTIATAPSRIITLNQGATELLLGMGLASSMVGTAYLDDSMWPRYAAAYSQIPVLSSGYPNETHLMSYNPDFLVASYNSAFRAQYTRSNGRVSGIFTDATVGPCAGFGSDWGQDWTTCRPQLHAAGIGTYVFEDSCEDTSLRPATVTEDIVYDEMRTLGSVFGVDVEPMITDMKADFDQAAALVSSGMHGSPLKSVWLDCTDCCDTEPGEEEQVFVGGGAGAPNLLMQEGGLSNVFADRAGNWACVNVSDIIAAAPDVIVVVDASWDSAIDKIKWMYNDAEFCKLEVLRAARFVSIPFSASTLGPRNGPAALDLAMAALHVRTGSQTATQESGVGSFSPFFLQAQTSCQLCPLSVAHVIYDDTSGTTYDPLCTTTTTTTTTTTNMPNNEVSQAGLACLSSFVAALGALPLFA